jgi:hypothetical protein
LLFCVFTRNWPPQSLSVTCGRSVYFSGYSGVLQYYVVIFIPLPFPNTLRIILCNIRGMLWISLYLLKLFHYLILHYIYYTSHGIYILYVHLALDLLEIVVSSNNKNDHHDITEILLKVGLYTTIIILDHHCLNFRFIIGNFHITQNNKYYVVIFIPLPFPNKLRIILCNIRGMLWISLHLLKLFHYLILHYNIVESGVIHHNYNPWPPLFKLSFHNRNFSNTIK